jgi:hypothetical protein
LSLTYSLAAHTLMGGHQTAEAGRKPELFWRKVLENRGVAAL